MLIFRLLLKGLGVKKGKNQHFETFRSGIKHLCLQIFKFFFIDLSN